MTHFCHRFTDQVNSQIMINLFIHSSGAVSLAGITIQHTFSNTIAIIIIIITIIIDRIIVIIISTISSVGMDIIHLISECVFLSIKQSYIIFKKGHIPGLFIQVLYRNRCSAGHRTSAEMSPLCPPPPFRLGLYRKLWVF